MRINRWLLDSERTECFRLGVEPTRCKLPPRRMRKCCQIFYEGKVQGVGFRFSIKQIAAGYDVTGYVKNLADGRVELVIAGDKSELDAFLEAIRTSSLGSHISSETRAEMDSKQTFRGFVIQ